MEEFAGLILPEKCNQTRMTFYAGDGANMVLTIPFRGTQDVTWNLPLFSAQIVSGGQSSIEFGLSAGYTTNPSIGDVITCDLPGVLAPNTTVTMVSGTTLHFEPPTLDGNGSIVNFTVVSTITISAPGAQGDGISCYISGNNIPSGSVATINGTVITNSLPLTDNGSPTSNGVYATTITITSVNPFYYDYSKVTFILPSAIKNVVYVDWICISNMNLPSPGDAFYLTIAEFNSTSSLTSSGIPYWRFIIPTSTGNNGNYNTNQLPVKLQRPIDYSQLTFLIRQQVNLSPPAQMEPVTAGPWAIELIFYTYADSS